MLRNGGSLIIFILLHVTYFCSLNTQQNYGRFTYNVSKLLVCKGPKRYDCSNNTAKIEDGNKMTLNMDIKSNVQPTKGKFVLMTNGQRLVKLQMKTPCDNMFMKPIIRKYLNVSSECEVQKGLYDIHFDVEKLAQEYFGGMFFYGNVSFKNVIYNDNCNFLCIIGEATLYPKNN